MYPDNGYQEGHKGIEPDGIGIAEAVYAGLRGITFNVADPPFNNKKLRRAVAHAVNKKEILYAAFYGFGEPDDQKYPKGHYWHFAPRASVSPIPCCCVTSRLLPRIALPYSERTKD